MEAWGLRSGSSAENSGEGPTFADSVRIHSIHPLHSRSTIRAFWKIFFAVLCRDSCELVRQQRGNFSNMPCCGTLEPQVAQIYAHTLLTSASMHTHSQMEPAPTTSAQQKRPISVRFPLATPRSCCPLQTPVCVGGGWGVSASVTYRPRGTAGRADLPVRLNLEQGSEVLGVTCVCATASCQALLCVLSIHACLSSTRGPSLLLLPCVRGTPRALRMHFGDTTPSS